MTPPPDNEVHVHIPGAGTRTVSLAQFEADVAQGLVPPQTMVWRPGLPSWRRAQLAFPTLFEASSPAYASTNLPPPPPSAPPDPPVLAPSGRIIANPWLRVCSRLIDGCATVLAGLILAIPLSVLLIIPFVGYAAYVLLLCFLPWLVVQGIACSPLSASPGQFAMGLEMQDAEGLRVSPGQVITRTLISPLSGLCLGIGLICAWFTTYRQTWHDMAGGVYVVMREKRPLR